MVKRAEWDHRGDTSWRQGALQTDEDKIERLREWLRRYDVSAELEVIEVQAYVDLTYPEWCQFSEYRAELRTVGEALDMITIRHGYKPRKTAEA